MRLVSRARIPASEAIEPVNFAGGRRPVLRPANAARCPEPSARFSWPEHDRDRGVSNRALRHRPGRRLQPIGTKPVFHPGWRFHRPAARNPARLGSRPAPAPVRTVFGCRPGKPQRPLHHHRRDFRGVGRVLAAVPVSAPADLADQSAYTHTEATFLEGVFPAGPFTPTNLPISGRTVPLVPKHRASLGLHWEFRPDTRLSVTGRYVGEQVMENDEPNTCGRRIPAYATADLRVSHRHGPFTVAVVVNNQR